MDISSMFDSTIRLSHDTNYSQYTHDFLYRQQTRLHGIKRRGYQLIDVPIVYHVLSQQGIGALYYRTNGTRTGPHMTIAQRDYATLTTNRLFNVYHKQHKQSIQFASFVTNATIVHDNFITSQDCYNLTESDYRSIISKATEWEYKMHVIVCEMKDWSGMANWYPSQHPLHTGILVDYRALACYDDDENFLCTPSTDNNGTTHTQISHTRWWCSRSCVIAHEFGHIFGLWHTFDTGCSSSRYLIPDVPHESHDGQHTGKYGCPGLLPYHKDRNLFHYKNRTMANNGANNISCHGVDKVCGTSCAACCIPNDENGQCHWKDQNESILGVLDNTIPVPVCCTDHENIPINSCQYQPGIDPLNNVMSYAPDFCVHEITPGQMFRMMSYIHHYIDYIYCNYATTIDIMKCNILNRYPYTNHSNNNNNICGSIATSPNC